jgi:glycosyltransferase 2 family protein
MKQIWSRLKPYLSWVILGGTLIFLAKTLKDHWREVAAIRIDGAGWACLAIALGVTLLAHVCAGWVWSWILQDFKQPIRGAWVVRVYLKTNIAKYIPGNVWHYYGRISAATNAGASLGAATISVLFEPLLMAASALIVALLGSLQLAAKLGVLVQALQVGVLLAVLLGIHPLVMNPVIRKMSKMKRKATGNTANSTTFKIDHYPLLPLLGELVFLLLRGTGFLFTFLALSPITFDQIPLLLSAFSLAWVLGLVIPGAPGGTGVFEATALALLDRTISPGVLLSIVALYRLISILSEAAGAGLATLDDRWAGTPKKT